MQGIAQLLSITLAALACSAAAAQPGPQRVAGLNPSERPAGAPVITEFARTDTWRTAATRGITPPVPESINRFLDDQGAWYSPFLRPGMPGPYDLRELHAPPRQAAR